MAIRIVQLGSPRSDAEGLRIGAVRRPPRGIAKSEYASRDIYDLWFPNLAPSETLLKEFRPVSDAADWKKFSRRYAAEMKAPDRIRELDLLAALSQQTDFSLGCYCVDERYCHRSLLREMLRKRGACLRG